MTETPQNSPNLDSQANISSEELIRSLRRKEGNWVTWGQSCQALQKSGLTPQTIFEETGFEPIHQNQVIVAAQVYGSILSAGASESVKTHFEQKGSDVLYELRILNQVERAALAEFALEKGLDMDEARDAAKAVKDLARMSSLPEGFTNHPGDAIAYQSWKLARQKSDLQERSRLVAKGLRFAHSNSARKKVEQLLTDFSVTPAVTAPRLPIYRLEDSEELPRVLPVVGKLPLTKADLQAVPIVDEEGPFRMVSFSGVGAWVPVPGWQVILTAEDPIVLISDSATLPTPLPGKQEEVLVVVDRAQRQWVNDRYFLVEADSHLQVQWFESTPDTPILGQVLLIMRPKKVLDENYTTELWQIDE